MKKTTSILILFIWFSFAAKILIAQSTLQWQKTYGGSNEDNIYIIQKTNDAGYILMGYSNSDSTSEKSENSWTSSYDYWVVKIDSLGNIQWQNTIGGNGNEIGTCVKQTR